MTGNGKKDGCGGGQGSLGWEGRDAVMGGLRYRLAAEKLRSNVSSSEMASGVECKLGSGSCRRKLSVSDGSSVDSVEACLRSLVGILVAVTI